MVPPWHVRLRLQAPRAVPRHRPGTGGTDLFLVSGGSPALLKPARTRVRGFAGGASRTALLGTHYHLLVETPEPTWHRGMQRLNGPYAQAFNRRHTRSATSLGTATLDSTSRDEAHAMAASSVHRSEPRASPVSARRLNSGSGAATAATIGMSDAALVSRHRNGRELVRPPARGVPAAPGVCGRIVTWRVTGSDPGPRRC